jgi:HEPN domain-containing protein
MEIHETDKLEDLIFIAAEDYISAEILAKNTHPVLCEIVNWHCQQAVEKWLKAYLLTQKENPPHIHDLSKLCKLCMAHDNSFIDTADSCMQLVELGMKVRYDRGLGLTEDDMRHALSLAKQVQDFFREKYPEIVTVEAED